eukprot:m.404011 g.404011  ORF g.404011 m.404011 type:complete len:76 (+) comp56470_c0_seq18:195-422(+)
MEGRRVVPPPPKPQAIPLSKKPSSQDMTKEQVTQAWRNSDLHRKIQVVPQSSSSASSVIQRNCSQCLFCFTNPSY